MVKSKLLFDVKGQTETFYFFFEADNMLYSKVIFLLIKITGCLPAYTFCIVAFHISL